LFSEYPFVKILIPFTFGILTGAETRPVNFIPLIVLFSFLLLLEIIKPSTRWKYRKKIGFLLQLHIFLLGFNCNRFQTNYHLVVQSNRDYIIHLVQLDKPGEKFDRYESEIYTEDDSHRIQHIKAYTYIASSLNQSAIGDVILTTQKPKPIQAVYNPGIFNFASFANQNGFHYSLFLNNNEEWVKLKNQENRLLSILHRTRNWIIYTIQSQLNNPEESGLTEALLIGYKEDLDDRLQEEYTLTGVSHIIAVSGMHLGLIFTVLASLFNSIARRETSRYLGFGLILPLLWTFALISGASASVLRSVLVFSIVLWGSVLLKKSGSINALFASAFILLVIRPSFICDIGYQLSYAAVLSILIYEPLTSKWINVNNILFKQLWKMISITLAAQILTTPIVLFHFKQFPLLFLITNLVAVPLSNIVLLLGILLCLLSSLLLPTQPIPFIIHCCIQMMNGYIEKVASISFNSIQIQTTLTITILLYATIAGLTYFFLYRKTTSILPILVLLFLLSLMYQINQHQLSLTRRILVLQVKNATYIIHQHGSSGTLITSSNHISNKLFFKKQLRTLSNELSIRKWTFFTLKDHAAVIELNNQNTVGKVILLSGFNNWTPTLNELFPEEEKPQQLIADGSTKLWKIKQWEKQAQEVHLRLHSTPEKGAFILSCEHR